MILIKNRWIDKKMVKKCNSMVELPELDGKVSGIKEA